MANNRPAAINSESISGRSLAIVTTDDRLLGGQGLFHGSRHRRPRTHLHKYRGTQRLGQPHTLDKTHRLPQMLNPIRR